MLAQKWPDVMEKKYLFTDRLDLIDQWKKIDE
jgi:hypothetical protein